MKYFISVIYVKKKLFNLLEKRIFVVFVFKDNKTNILFVLIFSNVHYRFLSICLDHILSDDQFQAYFHSEHCVFWDGFFKWDPEWLLICLKNSKPDLLCIILHRQQFSIKGTNTLLFHIHTYKWWLHVCLYNLHTAFPLKV